MYSPKIPERFIPVLYTLARSRSRPMTHLVAEAVQQYLEAEGILPSDGHERAKPNNGPRRLAA
jgi:hypothetical protein